MAEPPTPGTSSETTTIPEIGVTEWTLSNGVRVVAQADRLQRTTRSLSRAFSPGGHSLASDADFDSARFADDDRRRRRHRRARRRRSCARLLAGKVAPCAPCIGELEEGCRGTRSPRDLETMFQLVHLRFTAPRRDEDAFAAWRRGSVESMRRTAGSRPRRRSSRTCCRVLRRRTTRAASRSTPERRREGRPRQGARVLQGPLRRRRRLHVRLRRQRRSRASSSRWSRRYLGSLPSKGRKETLADVGVHLAAGRADQDGAPRAASPRAASTLDLPRRREVDAARPRTTCACSAKSLRIRLREVLREDMGGVYGVSAAGSISRRPRQSTRFTVSFGCAPDNVDKLKKAVFDEVAAIKRTASVRPR